MPSNVISLSRVIDMVKQYGHSEGCIYSDKYYLNRKMRIGVHAEQRHLNNVPVRTESPMQILCHEGSLRLLIDGEMYNIERHCVIFIRPNSIVQFCNEEACVVTMTVSDVSLMPMLNPSIQKLVPHALELREMQQILLTDNQYSTYSIMMEALEAVIRSNAESAYYHETVRNTLLSIVYFMMSILNENAEKVTEEDDGTFEYVNSHHEEIFKRFMTLLAHNFRTERKVIHYAERMHISPKYLSTIIKEVSKRSASEWIDEFVISESKNLLQFTDHSVQEISNKMHFANQSFFGKYFKAHTGYSPVAFRALHGVEAGTVK